MKSTNQEISEQNKSKELKIVWRNVVGFVIYHFIAFQGLYYMLTLKSQWKTSLFGILLGIAAGQGISSGVHRLWTHRTYKAKLPLQIILCILQTISLQNCIHEWARDHRVHHKFTDTDADPHNSTRGFFFSHMGWLMVRKHPDVIKKGQTVDMSDLDSDPVVQFQKKYYFFLGPFLCYGFPTLVPWYFWNENWYVALATAGVLRYVVSLHFTWLVNSAAHMWGYKPYDKNISSVEAVWVSRATLGEGWHNYHHVFPWDYKAAELGGFAGSSSTAIIEFFAKIGWAYDLKTASPEMIQKQILTAGDSTIHKQRFS